MWKVFTFLLTLVLAFFVFSVTNVSAKVITNQKGDVTIPKTEVVNDDLFIGAQTAEIDGTVNGDVFIGAQTVKITGNINGNLHVGANTLDLSGEIKGNVYTGAQTLLVSGSTIGGSLLVGAATVNIDKNSLVDGSIIAGAGSLTIDSKVARSVYAGTGNLNIGSDAKIGKDLYYATGNNQGTANISSDAKIVGNIYKSEAKVPQNNAQIQTARKEIPAAFGAFKLGSSIAFFIGSLIVAFLYLKLFGNHLTQTSGLVSKSFWKSFGTGFLVSIAFVPGLIILLITVIGIPVAGMAILLFILYSYLAKIVVGMPLGNWVSRKFNWKISNYGALVLGLLTIYILNVIPVIGFLSGLTVFWTGLGALTLKIFNKSE